jgi:hypothetical protein
MGRRTFDALMVFAGLALTVVLLVAGGLLSWAHNFVNNEVHSQLAAQKIYFPTRSNAEFKALPAADKAAMGVYAGQQMVNGAQAETYANHFIGYHLSLMGGTYSDLSAKAMAQPNNTKLAGLVNTVFKGTTLRSMLLNAWGFWQLGVIAGIAAIVSFIAAAVLLVLSFFGLYHLRTTPEKAEVLAKVAHPAPAKVQTV